MKKKLLLGLLGVSAILGLSACKDKEFTVTVQSNNGAAEDSFVVKEDGTLTAPANPTKEGYTFAGWFLDANFATAVDFANFKVTEDITLYAKWTINTYTVTFNTNGGSTVANTTVNHNNAVTLPQAPTKEGHTFVGWYTDEACTSQYTNGKITANTTLYAKWTKDAVVYVVTFNTDGGSDIASVNVEEGKAVTLPSTDPTKEGYTFEGWYVDEACTTAYTNQPINGATTLYAKWAEIVETVYTVTFDTKGGSEVPAQEVKEDEWGSFTVQKPADPTKPYAEFAGWFADEACTTPFDFSAEVTEDITIYAKWNVEYEMVTTVADFGAGAAAYPGKAKPTEEVTIGRFTFAPGVYFEEATSSKTACVNNQQKDITFQLNGRTNAINFNIKYGSSGSSGVLTLYKLVDGEKVEVQAWNEAGQSDYSIDNLTPGTYVFGSVGSYRFYSLSITEDLEKAAPVGLEIASMPQTAFLEGRDFNNSGLSVYLTYANGRKDILAESAYTVDSSAYVGTVPGTYSISISNGEFATSYDVVVYDVQSVIIADHVLNSSRVTLPLETVFINGSTFTTSNLAVNVTAVNVDNANDVVTFVLNKSEYSVSAPDMNTLGAQTVTVTAFELTNTYEINVVNNVLDANAEKVTVNVVAGAAVSVTTEGVTFNSVNAALRYLELCNLPAETIKEVKVAAGSYYEKVEVKLPNVHLIGSNNESAESVIWYDRINGMTDPSGTISYSTDGAASISIRSTAVGFYAQDITLKNYYNTHELYLESLKISTDSQATAVLVQADQSYFKNVKFSSYHDTLYAQIGRQYYENCYIEGRTDYIFGYNATAYFEGCTIRTIGAGLDQNNGGYVVATKGLSSNKGTDDIKYGYIFNECVFEADENTQPGSVSIARGWAECMAVMVMNSEISGAFSKEVYGNSESKLNDRYTKMNAEPVASLLLEYNNTGEGALVVPEDNAETADVNEAEAFIAQYAEKTCTIVTDASVAAAYADLIKVFAAENGNVKWNEAWGGNLEKNAVVEFKTADGTVVATLKSYVGAKLTKSQIYNVELSLDVPQGYKFVMFASDAQGTTEYEIAELAETNTIYVVLESLGGAKQVELVYSGDASENPNFVISQAASGSTKWETLTEGAANGSGISLMKLVVGTDYIETVEFDAVKSAKVELLGGTSSTGNAQIFKVEALNAAGEVVATVYSAPSMSGKVLGYMLDAEGNKYVEVTSDVEFVKVRISASGDRNTVGDGGAAGKNFCPAVVKVSYEVVVAQKVEVSLNYAGDASDNSNFVISQAASGSTKWETLTEGAANGSGISLMKLVVGTDYIETVEFDAVKSAKVELLGGTSSTGNAQIFKVEALNAAGEVVATVYSAPSMSGKVLGYMLDAEGNKYVEVTSDVEFVKVRISASGDRNTVGDGGAAGKNFCPAIVTVTYVTTVGGVEEVTGISQNTTYSFNSGDSTVEKNYFVLTSGLKIEGSTAEFEGLTIDATTGKLSDNGGSWFQFNNTTSISFEVAKACTIQVKLYQDSTAYTVNGVAADATNTFTITKAGMVTITSTSNGYIGYIYITF